MKDTEGEIMHAMTLRIPELKPIIELVEKELLFAREKFPSNKHMLHALTEECGEVTQEMLNQYHILRRGIADPVGELDRLVQKELLQTICMCIRVLTEGDADLPYNPAGGYGFKSKV